VQSLYLRAENAVDKAGILPHGGPLAHFFDNPLMPSGAALFVSATVMLLDFTRPHWGPVTSQAKDWVVRSLHLCAPPPLLFRFFCFLLSYCPDIYISAFVSICSYISRWIKHAYIMSMWDSAGCQAEHGPFVLSSMTNVM
jgi:hypothetical protein